VAAAAVGTTDKTIGLIVRGTSGLPPRRRACSPLRLSVAEREEISRHLVAGASLRAIARSLGLAPSTVGREVARNGGRRRYRAWRADAGAIRRARRPRIAKLARNPRLRGEIERLLGLRWSPEQIAARLRFEHPLDRELGEPRDDLPERGGHSAGSSTPACGRGGSAGVPGTGPRGPASSPTWSC